MFMWYKVINENARILIFWWLKGVFVKNGYPECFFLSCVKKFLNDRFASRSNVTVKDDKVETIFFIPYIGLPSVIFGHNLRKLF